MRTRRLAQQYRLRLGFSLVLLASLLWPSLAYVARADDGSIIDTGSSELSVTPAAARPYLAQAASVAVPQGVAVSPDGGRV